MSNVDEPLDPDTQRFLTEQLAGSLRFIRDLDDLVVAKAAPAVAPAPDPLDARLSLRPLFLPAHEADGAGPGASGKVALLPASGDRYVIEAELASGGSGQILNALDQGVGRRVAMKVLRKDRQSPRTTARFLEEARATGQLEHPNIPPVYDVGVHPDHGIYFTMRLVRGRTLREILRDLSINRLETQRQFSLTRLVQILEQVAMGIHYAHVRGVIHRDLKPENIMVGDFGEVLVLDWGVAKIAGPKHESSIHQDPVRIVRGDPIDATRDGTVSGTLSYMAPEQARGWVGDIDERTDVFGLGAVLYEILTFHAPYAGDDPQAVLARAAAGEIVPPRIRAPRNAIPRSLEEICLKALRADRQERHADAMVFYEQLQVFLDGTLEAERRSREASQLVAQGKQLGREYRRLTDAEARLREEAARKLQGFAPHDPVELKAPAWQLLDQADARNRERTQAFSDATALLHSAINIDATSTAAREALADLYWQRFEESDRSGDASEAAIYRRLVERYDQGRFAPFLQDMGSLTVVSQPPGARVSLHRIVERGWRKIEEAGEALGPTPLKLELPLGEYALVFSRDGYRDTKMAVRIQRSEALIARANLYTEAEIGPGFLLVPQGESVVGGDPSAPGSLAAGRRYVADFFIAEYPVTYHEYCLFLDDLLRANDPELARWTPRAEIEGSFVRRNSDGLHEPSVEALDLGAETRARHTHLVGGCERHLPVFGVSWFAAERYCRWLSERRGRRVRLLKDIEWEKAARGVAGWIHPWGDRFDWSLLKGGLSRPERAQPEPVGAFATDRSIYGVRDLAGTIREWCQDWFVEGQYRLTRGGSWSNVHEGGFRAAHRLGTKPDNVSSLIGFRVAVQP